MQITHPLLLNIPTDCLFQILNKIDSNTLVRTTAVSKLWLGILEIEWQRRSQQLTQSKTTTASTWREHYFIRFTALRLRQIEEVCRDMYCTALGTTLFFIDDGLKISSFNTDHEKAINIIKSSHGNMRGGLGLPIFLTGSLDKTIKVWDYTFKKPMLYATCEGQDRCTSALLPIGRNFVAGGYNGSLYYWIEQDRKYSLHQKLSRVHKAAVICLELYHCRRRKNYVASGASDGTIALSILMNGTFRRLQTLRGHKDSISGMGFIKEDGECYLVTGCATESAIKIWRLQTNPGKLVFNQSIRNAHPGGVIDIQSNFSGNFSGFYSLGNDEFIKKWYRGKEDSKYCVPKSALRIGHAYTDYRMFLFKSNKIARMNADGMLWKQINEDVLPENQT